MSVSGISSTSDVYQTDQQNTVNQRNDDFKQLGKSLQSGDLAGAQKAFAALQQDVQSTGQSQSGQQTSQNDQKSQALQNLADSLKSGDLAGAQKAFSTLKSHHGHHHRGSGATQSATAAGTDSAGASTGSTNAQITGNNVNVTV